MQDGTLGALASLMAGTYLCSNRAATTVSPLRSCDARHAPQTTCCWPARRSADIPCFITATRATGHRRRGSGCGPRRQPPWADSDPEPWSPDVRSPQALLSSTGPCAMHVRGGKRKTKDGGRDFVAYLCKVPSEYVTAGLKRTNAGKKKMSGIGTTPHFRFPPAGTGNIGFDPVRGTCAPAYGRGHLVLVRS